MPTLLSGLFATKGLDPVTQGLLELRDTEANRLFRYQLNWEYYRNRMYDWVRDAKPRTKSQREMQSVLYKYIKPLFNVCTLAVDIDVAAVLIDPIVSADDVNIENRIVDIWKRSRLQRKKSRLVRFGAVCGDSYLRVVDREDGTASILVHSPQEMMVEYDQHDQDLILGAKLEYVYWEGSKSTLYTLIILPDRYRTFRDGKPFDYSTDRRGVEWENALGFVPVVHVRNLDIGEPYGISTFDNVIPTLDQVNDLASRMARIIQMNADPVLVAHGVKPGTIERGEDSTGTKVIYIPAVPAGQQPPQLGYLEWSGNVASIVEFLNWARQSVIEQLPEMDLRRVQEQAGPSGYSVSLQTTLFQNKIKEMRDNYLEALLEANKMALWAEDIRKGMTLAQAQAQDYGHSITCGSILPRDEQMEQNLVLSKLAAGIIDRQQAMMELGYDNDEIDEIITRADAEREKMMYGSAAFGVPGGEGSAG